jgi:hypothetical protein
MRIAEFRMAAHGNVANGQRTLAGCDQIPASSLYVTLLSTI